MHRTSLVFILAVAIAGPLTPRRGPCAEVALETVDGRILQGELDARSDAAVAWVRQQSDALQFTASASWEAVATATLDGAAIDVETLRSRHDELSSEAEPVAFITPADAPPQAIVLPFPAMHFRGQVQSLQLCDARVVNLDRDSAPDGLELAVSALDRYGAPLEVCGNLYVQLWTERRPWPEPEPEFELTETWSVRLVAADFVDGVAIARLRFRHLRIRQELDVLPGGLVTVRLGVPGDGNYTASGPIYLRPISPYRDRLQNNLKTRYLPGELRGRGRSSFGSARGRYQAWPWAP